MKIINHTNSLIIAISILLFSCNKEKYSPYSQARIWNCHHELTWDSTSVNETLIGEWEWEYILCIADPQNANDEDHKGTTIEFKSDNTLDVIENGEITQTSNWKVVDGDSDLYKINVDPYVIQLYGRILFCEKRVEFNNSYIDGCDNYFMRIE